MAVSLILKKYNVILNHLTWATINKSVDLTSVLQTVFQTSAIRQ